MIRCIIFDLSEVLIAGLVGIEKALSQELPVPEDEILPCFGGYLRDELFVGDISEDTYLRQIIAREEWAISTARLRTVIRDNFHREVEGTLPILTELGSRCELALLSDHAREWIAYIESIHPFLEVFEHTFYSYDLGKLKREPGTFLDVLDAISLPPRSCLFVDDNPVNVAVARSVDIPSVRFVNAEQLTAELERRLAVT
ncbi:MAG: HAD family hydrolase [Anaerolineae bacterium]